MAIIAAILGGLGALSSTVGAIGSAVNNRKAQKERTRAYEQSKDFLNGEYYRDPMSSVGNRALLKSLDQRMKDRMDEINNRSAAGGATMENQLAAKQSSNEVMGNVYTNLLRGEDARRQALAQQKMQLDNNYSAGTQASYQQDAQNWSNWGSAMSNALIGAGSTYLLEGGKDTIGDLIKNWGKKPKTTFGKINPLQAISSDNSLGSVTR